MVFLAPIRSTLCLSRTGLWFSLSHSTTSWHSGIHRPGSNWSTSFLEIWGPIILNFYKSFTASNCTIHLI